MSRSYLIIVFLYFTNTNSQTFIENVKLYDSTESYISKNYSTLEINDSVILKKNKSTKIYYNPSGYDELKIFVDNNLKIDTILNKNSSYPLFILEIELNDCKEKNIIIEMKRKNKLFKFDLKNKYKSIVIFPYVNNRLVNLTGAIKEEKEETTFSEFEDFVEIHLLKFDYFDYLIKYLSHNRFHSKSQTR